MTRQRLLYVLLLSATSSVARAQSPDPIFRDGFQCPYPQFAEIGGPCTSDSQCDSAPAAGDGICLAGAFGPSQWPAPGYCSRACSDGANCGAGATCTAIAFCLPACCAGAACAPGFVCIDQLLGYPLGTTACVPGDPDAVDGSPCADIGDCDGAQCLLGVEHPGGECSRLGCTVGMDATCSQGSHCATLPPMGPACLYVCTSNANCRLSDGYRCVDGGAEIGAYCRAPHVGDACAIDDDCGDPAIWDCRTGVAFPGGYCTMPCPTPGSSEGCPEGSSVCAEGGLGLDFCADRCDDIGTQSLCRPGYFCSDVDPSPVATIGGCVSP
jgi:hypothetical protein